MAPGHYDIPNNPGNAPTTGQTQQQGTAPQGTDPTEGPAVTIHDSYAVTHTAAEPN